MAEVNAFKVGGHFVEPGRHCKLELLAPAIDSVPDGCHQTVSLDVEVFHGRRRGPACWVSAGIHGDELNGVEIARRLVQRLDPQTLRGTVLVLPVVNRSSFSTGERRLPDGSDLNRLFPGRFDGEPGERLAALVMSEIVERCRFGFDLHTGSDGRENLPQIHARLDDEDTAELARAFEAPVLLAAEPRPGTLRAAAAASGRTTLVYEGGADGRLCDRAIAIGLEGVWRSLRHVGMVAEDGDSGRRSRSAAEPFIPRRSCWLRSPTSGVLSLTADLGSAVEKGGSIGRLGALVEGCEVAGSTRRRSQPGRERTTSSDQTDSTELRSTISGRVIGRTRRRYVRRGEPILHVASAG